MADESPIAPLAPSGDHSLRSDQEYFPMKLKPLRQEKSSKCLVYFLLVLVSLSAVLLVLASIFLRANTPDVKLRSVTVKNLRHSSNATSPFFNATLVAELTIENENFGYFKFKNGTGSFWYGGAMVGDLDIREGRVEARETKSVNVTVDVRSSDVYNSHSKNLSVDITSGMLNLYSYAKLQGRVNLLDVLKKTKTPELNCSMNLALRSQKIQDLVCGQ